MYDLDNYDKTLALQDNYGELISENRNSYINSALIVQIIINVK